MTDFFANPWIIGIGGGIISGFLVAVITRAIFSRKDNREYVQRVGRANSEILAAFVPMIAEEKMPDLIVTTAIIRSTARKYGLQMSDVYNVDSLCEDIIAEVVSTGFLSTEQKNKFSQSVATLLRKGQDEQPLLPLGKSARDDRSRNSNILSFYMAVMSAFATIMAFSAYFVSKNSVRSENLLQTIMLIMGVTVVFAMVMSIVTVFARRLKMASLILKTAPIRAEFTSKEDSEQTDLASKDEKAQQGHGA